MKNASFGTVHFTDKSGPNALCVGNLKTKKTCTYLALQGFSVIHPGTMYGAELFSTTRDLIPPCKPPHRLILFVDSNTRYN